MENNKCLVVLIPDSLNSLYQKGEITTNYYNPGNHFKEVHLITTNNNAISPTKIQKAVGNAKIYIHYLPKFLSFFPLMLPAFYYGKWIEKGFHLVAQIKPQLIRVHGHSYPGMIAVYAGKRLSIPVVISIHTQPDISWRKRISFLRRPLAKIHAFYHQFIENYLVRSGAKIICVYQPAYDYVIKHKGINVSILYNCLNNRWKKCKISYKIKGVPKLVVVGRQIQWKKPDKIILALKHIPEATLTLIGDGDEHTYLKNLADKIDVHKRCTFLPHVNNDDLIDILISADIFLHSSLYPEISKSTIEAMIVGLPIIHNIDQKALVKELHQDHIFGVKNRVNDFVYAIKDLINHQNRREHFGKTGYQFAKISYQPIICEKKYTSLYKELIADAERVLNK